MDEINVEIKFYRHIPQESLPLIPKQRDHIDNMLSRKVISGYTASVDKRTLWLTFKNKTEQEVIEVIESFPLADFFEYTFKPVEVQD